MIGIIEVLGALAGAALAVIGALLWGRRQGARDERERRAGEDARAYRHTRQEMDDADLGIGAADADHTEWLRRRADDKR